MRYSSFFAGVSLHFATSLVVPSHPVSSHLFRSSTDNRQNSFKLNVATEPDNGDSRFDPRPLTAWFCRLKAARSTIFRRGRSKDETDDENRALFPSTERHMLTSDTENDVQLVSSNHEALQLKPEQDVGLSPVDLEKLWLEKQSLMDDKYTEHVIENMKLGISLDEFYNLFLSDHAPKSLESYHRDIGDSNVQSTRWESTLVDGFLAQKRKLTYRHPIKIAVPKAPSHGVASKAQTIVRFGNHGIHLTTETWINGVPFADCFYIADQLIIASEPDGGIRISMKFGNCFVKKTMFKKILNSASAKSVMEFHQGYIDSLRRAVNNYLYSQFG